MAEEVILTGHALCLTLNDPFPFAFPRYFSGALLVWINDNFTSLYSNSAQTELSKYLENIIQVV